MPEPLTISLFTGLLAALSLHYAAVMSAFARGFHRVRRHWSRVKGPDNEEDVPFPTVSVVVPVRNEAASVRACVESILANEYPADRFEVIVVDDASTDATPAILSTLQRRTAVLSPTGADSNDWEGPPLRFRVETLAPDVLGTGSRKRRALEAGIAVATGEIILTTDGDCTVPQTWIRSMTSAFREDTGFVAGPVLFPVRGSMWAQAQALEFLGLVTIGAGAIGIGRPILCNGANVAYRRDLFDHLGGFDDSAEGAAGDDELFMWKVAESGRWTVRFCPALGAAVSTPSAPDLPAFVRQRLRWASLASRYPSPTVVAALVAIFLFYLLLLAGLVATAFVPELLFAVVCAWGAKAAAEAFVLVPACRHFGRLRLLVWLVPAQIFQSIYIVACSAAGTLRRYTWNEPTVSV